MLDQLAPRIRELLRAASVPGCSIAIVDAGGVREARGFGLADLRTERPAQPETVYHFCSVTKVLTVAAAMRLVERGKLSLDAEVAALLPELRVPSGIAVRQLMNHTSGLRDDYKVFLRAHFEGDPAPSVAEALSAYRLQIARPPGERVSYCNTGFVLLGALIERFGERPYPQVMVEEVLAPLSMAASFRMLEPELRPRAATGYFARWDLMGFLLRLGLPGTMRRLRGPTIDGYTELARYDLDAAPIGGLCGSVLDLAAFVRDQLAGTSSILGEASRQAMRTRSASGSAGSPSARAGVGLGWKLGQSPQGAFLLHEGGAPGYTAEIRLYPERGLGVVWAANRFASRISKAFHPISEAVCELSARGQSWTK